MQIRNEDKIDGDLVEVENGHFKQLIPWYEHAWYDHYNRYDNDYYNYDEAIFDYAHNETCSCATGFIDSTIETQDFQIKNKLELNLTGQSWPCNDDMEESECYYKLREYDNFDMYIENVAKDGCVYCYGVGPDLWPIQQNQLMKRLTRSDGDKLIHYEDCSPKSGYHKSRGGEIYRCEGGDDKVGVMAFTEANGDTYFECGYFGYNAVNVMGNDYYHYNHYNLHPIFMVSSCFF